MGVCRGLHLCFFLGIVVECSGGIAAHGVWGGSTAWGSAVKPSKKIFLVGKSLLGSLVFTRYWEPRKKIFFSVSEPSRKKGFCFY